MKRPTIADIARRAGVSKGAVSFALNDQPGVSAETRRRVLAIAQEIGWTPNGVARALSGAPSHTIGMALRRPARILGVEPFFMELISGVEAELSAREYALVAAGCRGSSTPRSPFTGAGGRSAGWTGCCCAICGWTIPGSSAGGAGGAGCRHRRGGRLGRLVSVGSNDGAGVTEAVEYLVTLGHRHIARVAGLPELLHTVVRTEAFTEVCAGLDIPPAITVFTDYTGEEGARATRRLLSSRNRPTAIVYDNDVMAIAGLAVAHEMGLSVPGDVSLIAWDDSVLCQLVHPPMTALSRDIPAYGARAVRQLLEIIAGNRPASSADEPPHLIPRGTTGRP